MSIHRWSGWPGAFCLDCGIEDPVEDAICCRECYVPCHPDDKGPERFCPEHRRWIDIAKSGCPPSPPSEGMPA